MSKRHEKQTNKQEIGINKFQIRTEAKKEKSWCFAVSFEFGCSPNDGNRMKFYKKFINSY